MIKQLNDFTCIGIYSNTLKIENKRIKIINYCCLIGIVNVIIFFNC